MKKLKFKIVDWAYNDCFQGRIFDSFEDAWDFILETFPNDETGEDLGEYEVVVVGVTL